MELFYTDNLLDNDFDYQEFIKENPGKGYLKIRASAAYEAIPIEGIKVKVTKQIGNNVVVFYEGETDHSGMINNIVLPAPLKNTDDLIAPKFTTYDVIATGSTQDINKKFNVNIYCCITVIQYINVVPNGYIRSVYGN